jgi:putative oxygen-independent coproporphyrinogen III oxidase
LTPLAVYIHWPYCARICPYCNVFRARGRDEEAEALARAIVSDLEGQAALTGPRELISVFFGGGTPSLMRPDQAAMILDAARRLWRPAEDLEVTLEANPTDAEAQRYRAFAEAGVTRLSLGLQALDDASLKFLGRDHDAAEGQRAAHAALDAFRRVSLDLIYARPGQTPGAWAAELSRAARLGAEHISPYQLTIEAGTAFDRAVARGAFATPEDDLAADLYETTQAVLEAEGFAAYEVSNHARSEAARSRHNLAGWRGYDYAGAGPGAHGRLTLGGVRIATRAAARPVDYIRRVHETGVGFVDRAALSEIEAGEERLLMGLRIAEGVSYAEVAALGLAPDAPSVMSLIEAGFLADDPARLRATPGGRRVLDGLISRLATAGHSGAA